MTRTFSPGQIVRINGGTYDGQGARVCKVDQEKGKAEVIIAGKVRKLGIERLEPYKIGGEK